MEKIREERLIDGESFVIESSLSRIYLHAEKNGFFILSAFRGTFTMEQNLKRQDDLKKDLRKSNLGFIEMHGRWIEEYKDGSRELKTELSLFVPYNIKAQLSEGEFFDLAIKLMYNYNQDAIVYKSTTEKEIYVLDKKLNSVFSVGVFTADKIGEIYSTLKYGSHAGRNFLFEGVTAPSGSNHAMFMRKQGYNI